MKKILSIDGGGMAGYNPAYFLARLERKIGRPLHQHFDMIAGTSIGGILALLISSGAKGEDLPLFFDKYGPRIFPHIGELGDLKIIEGPLYSEQNVESVMAEVFGEKKMSDLLTNCFVTTVDVVHSRPLILNQQTGCLVRDAARATSAAQIYFPGKKFGDMIGSVMWDGGNVANNPALVAYAKARKMWPDEPVMMLSLGCGSIDEADTSNLVTPNPFHAAIKTVDILFNGGASLVDELMEDLLGLNYYRVQPKGKLPLDDASDEGLGLLREQAMESVLEHESTLEEWASL